MSVGLLLFLVFISCCHAEDGNIWDLVSARFLAQLNALDTLSYCSPISSKNPTLAKMRSFIRPNRCLGNLQEFILPWKFRWKITSAIGMRRERTRQLGSHSFQLPLQKLTKYLEKTTVILHWQEKTMCFFFIIFLLFTVMVFTLAWWYTVKSPMGQLANANANANSSTYKIE